MNYTWEDVITKEMNEKEADGVDLERYRIKL